MDNTMLRDTPGLPIYALLFLHPPLSLTYTFPPSSIPPHPFLPFSLIISHILPAFPNLFASLLFSVE